MFAWLHGSPTSPPLLLALRSSKTFIILTVATSIFTDLFVYGIVVPVLPFALTTRAAVPPAKVQTWISIFLAVYGAALLVAAPICGWLADRSSSRRGPMILGLVALGASTAMLCAGSSIGVLAAGRVLQGFSAAVVWVVGLALLVDTVGPEEIGQAMGFAGVSMSLAMLLAPLLGGVVFDLAGYYAVFAMAFGLMVLDVFMRVVLVEKKVAARWIRPELESGGEGGRKDSVGAGRDVEMEEPRAKDGDEPSAPTDDPDPALNPSATTTTTTPAISPSRLPPVLTLLASRRLLSALFACVIQASLLTAFDSLLPLYVHHTFHWTSLGAGLIFLPLVLSSFLGPLVGHLTDRHGPRLYAVAGYILACPCLILLRLVHHDSMSQKVLLCALLALVGMCLTLELTPIMAEITYAVADKAARRPEGYYGKNGAYAQAYSLFNVAWAAGCMIGPLLGGLVAQGYGWGTATLILGVVSGATAVPVAIWTGGSVRKVWRGRRDGEGEGVGV